MSPLRIYIGYDPRESVAWHTCVNSILKRSTIPVSFCPLRVQNLQPFFNREKTINESNEFSYSRFLAPYLSNYEGFSLYLDCDMLFTCDIKDLIDIVDLNVAISVVKHEYTSSVKEKFLGNKQLNYPRKNWSSFMLFNNAHSGNKILTPEYCETQPGSVLHRLAWLDDKDIGSLDLSWNFLVGEYPLSLIDGVPNNIHWTLGGPYFSEYNDTAFASLWEKEAKDMCFVQNAGPRCPEIR
jgi:lipopolysaccharide biosynthesis glycosyltransferase